MLLSSWHSKPPVIIEPQAYMLGAVKDYLGRSSVRVSGKLQLPNKVDEFHDTEQPLLDYVARLLETNGYLYSIIRRHQENCTNCHEFQTLESEQLAKQINNCYSFRFDSKGWDEQERVIKVYHGRLIAPRLRDRRSKLSFLAGAYARYGSHRDSVYTIMLGNSTSKYNLITHQLNTLRCRIEANEIIAGVPTAQKIRFVPTVELRAYLDEQNPIVDSIAVQRKRSK